MAIPTWSQLTFLTAGQQTKAAQFADIGQQWALYQAGKGPLPDLSPVTYSQAKAAEGLMKDLGSLVGPCQIGIRYVREVVQKQALADLESANP